MNNRKNSIGSSVLLQNEQGQVLVVKRSDDGLWCLPGGWVEAGETPDQAAVREAKEETGLRVKLVSLGDVHVRDDGTVHLIYFAEAASGTLKNSAESTELAYRALAEIEHWHKDYEVRVRRALANKVR